MNNEELQTEFDSILEEDGMILVLFNMAQELVQDKTDKEAQALNMITGSAFALFHAIKLYKEIKNGKSNNNGTRTSHSKDRSRLS